MTPPIIDTFYRVDSIVTRVWRYGKRFAFGALLGYAFLAHRKVTRYERIATEADGALAAAHTRELHNAAALSLALQRMDTTARVAVDYVERWDTDTLWRHDTVTVNGEQRLAVPLTAVAIADSTARSCRRLEGAAQAYATACDSTIASLYEEMTALKNKWFAARIVPPPPPPPSTVRPTLTYALLFAGADYANRQFHFDADRGGYVDRWTSMDKLTHAAFGATLAITAVDMGVKPKWAIALTCAGAAGFEWSQGYSSGKDLISGCGGAVAGVGLRWTARHLVGRR